MRDMNTWNYHPSRDIGVPISKRLRGFPREPGMLAYAVRSLAVCLAADESIRTGRIVTLQEDTA